MNVPIKFCGRVIKDWNPHGDKIVYGSLKIIYPHYYSGYQYTHWINTGYEVPNVPVEPDSVKQLVTIDQFGNEVYEGDTIITSDGKEWVAKLSARAVGDDETIVLDTIAGIKLIFTRKETTT